MAMTENGAIDYRKRIQSRKNQPTAAKEALQAAVVAEPAVESAVIADPANADAVTAETVTEGEAQSAPAPAETAMSRTPQAVREQAKSAVGSLLRVSEAEYTAMMTELSVADPILYAAVVDEINDARAAETKTA